MSNTTGARLRHPAIPADVAICSRCEQVNNRAPHRYCRACHAAYQRDWRAGRIYVPRDTNVSRGPDEEALHVAGAVAALDDRLCMTQPRPPSRACEEILCEPFNVRAQK